MSTLDQATKVSAQFDNIAATAGVSVVACCHNSAERIALTLEHLARQQVRCAWEVIVVDNGSSDDTAAIVERSWRQYGSPAPLRLVNEPRLGLSFARERGISQAQHEYVVLCDDDNWLDENYIQTALDIMNDRPEVGVVGGWNEPVSDVELPAWFWTFSRGYAVGVQALDSGDITGRRLVWGAGMVLRRSVYIQIRDAGVPSFLTDRKGSQLSTGGDNEMCMWFILAGYRLWYDEGLRLQHFIPKDRLTKEYCRRLRSGTEAAGMMLARYGAVVKSLETKRTSKRMAAFLAGVARMCLGNQFGRFAAQAFSPLPTLRFDPLTRDLQRIADTIRACARPPQRQDALTTDCIAETNPRMQVKLGANKIELEKAVLTTRGA